MDEYFKYGPLIIMFLGFLWQYRIFVTPEQLEKKHREISKECREEFVSIKVFEEFQNETKEDFKEVKQGIANLYSNTNDIKEMLMRGVGK